MTRTRSFRIIFAVALIVALILPATVASAQTGPSVPPPIAIKGPRLSPPAIPHSSVLDPYTVYNFLAGPGVPVQSLEANAADGGRLQEGPGRGIRQTSTGISFGILLYDQPNVCNDFNANGSYASTLIKSDIWTDWYGGWAPFAIDDGYYQAKNTTFSRERVVGPGNKYNDETGPGPDQNSVKIASNQRPHRTRRPPVAGQNLAGLSAAAVTRHRPEVMDRRTAAVCHRTGVCGLQYQPGCGRGARALHALAR
jgi:hypothetical protein